MATMALGKALRASSIISQLGALYILNPWEKFVYSVPWTCSLLAGGSGSFATARVVAASGDAAITSLAGGTAGLSAGGVTFAVCEVAGSSGRTGSVESFAFAGGGSEGSAPFAVELVAEVVDDSGICFFSGAFAGFAAGAVEAGAGRP